MNRDFTDSEAQETPEANESIAIIGMSGRFPDAQNPDEFWQNLINGKDSITRFPARTEKDGNSYVGARSLFTDPDKFDASFFGIYPKEAELMDPQHRVFLECSWEALEDAGYDPATFPGMVGVYAGLSLNTYLLHNLGKGKELAKNYQVGEYQTMLGNDKDFLPVRVSYKLNLRGPSMTIQSACSTSLVAICQAATALLTYQCDMALTGGVSISFPQQRDYLYQEEGMVSPDGTCRAFDAQAAGTVFGHGCGVVLLKRLSEAIADRDPILAVIKGWAVNNDGSDKIGFAAPGLNAQAECVALAQASAGISPSEISYIEAHGTGTPLGDPIEIAALTKAFRQGGADQNGYCTIGTAKTHIGHLDCAAGVTGLIKTIQQLRHEKIPALLHYTSPNPRIDFANSPFTPASVEQTWQRSETPRLAGVSAFGVGGTNAHLIVSEAPLPQSSTSTRKAHLLILSAKTQTALDLMASRLADHLEKENSDLAAVSYTLATGRRAFSHRRSIVAADIAEAVSKLRESSNSTTAAASPPQVAFLFPGQGSQYINMGRELYETEATFSNAINECATLLRPSLSHDIRLTLYPSSEQELAAAERDIHLTALTQPCIFAVEFALAKLWVSWGIQPSMLIGHSIGEYVAAVLAETLTLEHALQLLATRARLMQSLPSGSMLAVRSPIEALDLPETIDLAAINSDQLCTVSGTHEAIYAYQKNLEALEIGCRLLKTSHAFHSAMMEPIINTFTEDAAMIPINPPTISWISTATGQALDHAALSQPTYWSQQLRNTVQFAKALSTAYQEKEILLLEVGPGQALAPFARQHPSRGTRPVISTFPSSSNDLTDILSAVGQLWNHGVTIDWIMFFKSEKSNRLRLPTYPFERQSYWIDNSSEAIPTTGNFETPTLPQATAKLIATPATPPMCPYSQTDFSEKIRVMIRDLSGMNVVDDTASFTELGFDSLFLTQASQAIQSRFSVKVTFRQMLSELSSVATLATYLGKNAPASQAITLPQAITPTNTSPSSIEQLMASNLQLMQAMLAGQKVPTNQGATQIKWPSGFVHNTHTSTRFGPYKPLDKGEKGELTEQQKTALESLISRYTTKTSKSKSYTNEHRPHYADPRAVAGFKSSWKEMVYPIVSSRSKGSKIWDIDDNEYVDITMGFGTYFFGHSPDWLIEAIQVQLKKGIEIGPQSALAGNLAKEICELTGMERATFCNTGSEAVMAAMRLARTISGRDRIAYFTGDYHGMFEEVLVRGLWIDGIYKPQAIAPGIPQSLVENMLVLDYADPASLEILKAHSHELAAVMIEPVQSRAPGIQPRDFMREVRVITENAGTALIFDEVVTGFRCAPGGAQAYFGVEADMATYGKVIGGGMPIGILAGKRKYMDALDGGAWNYGDDSFPEVGVTFFAGTFVRHPLALAAASSVVKHLKTEGPRLQIEMEERVSRLCQTLNRNFVKSGVPIRIPHFSAHAIIEHDADLKHISLLWYLLREKGIHIWEGRPLYFTTAHTDEDFDKIIIAFNESVNEMQAAGFLPSGSDNLKLHDSFPRLDSSPTTEAQREIFYAVQQGDEANCSFNESNIILLEGKLDTLALKVALNDIVTRHPALRSTFSEDGQTQYFHPSKKDIQWTEHHFSSLSDQNKKSLLPLSLIKSAESSVAFDLTSGPLFRIHLVELSEEQHELLFTAHHMICDGWSFGMILSELATAYNARKSHQLPKLPPAVSFATYARMEYAEKNTDKTNQAEQFWIGKYKDSVPVLDLPADRIRPPNKTYSAAMATITLDAARFEKLKKEAPKLGGTIFTALLTAFGTLLHRITNQNDIVIGIPAAGQTRVGSNELIGHCLNFLPLRLNPSAEKSYQQFSAEVKENILEAYDHQNYTFGSLLKKIKIPRDTSRIPLISVIFNVDKSGIDQLNLDGIKISCETNPKQYTNFELFFNIVQTDQDLKIECEYNTNVHDAATIQCWLSCYEQIIDSAIKNSHESLKNLSLLSNQDKNLLNSWNKNIQPLPIQLSIHQFFEDQVDKTPQAIAILDGSRKFTYSELDSHANALSKILVESGATRESLVGICSGRCAETIIAILAVLKAGAAYVPIDPKYPKERISYILNDTNLSILLTQNEIIGDFPPLASVKTILIDNVLVEKSGRLDINVNPIDLAYVIYTSGSTGKPKGVAIEHHSAIALIDWALSIFSKEELSGVLFSTSICFDLSIFELFVTLASGGSIIISENILELEQNEHRSKITLINTVPSAISELLDARLIPESVKTINLAGEILTPALVDRIYAHIATVKVYDLYGPSEDTTYSTFKHRKLATRASIGVPISNTQTYIVDHQGNRVPPGMAGELLLGGEGLARHYLNNPELTAEKFVSNNFEHASSAMLYKTGDLARFYENGEIEFLGRIDDQVKLRGYRIELGEIEYHIEQYPTIEQAVVIVKDGELVAYLRQYLKNYGTAIWRDQWNMLYENAIEQTGTTKLDRLDSVIAGWTNATNLEIQVTEWIEATVERIQEYQPKKVYEIGCGTGQLLSRISPQTECYWASDISSVAIDSFVNHDFNKIRLYCRPADDFSEIPRLFFDTVIINSVIQYFPDVSYFKEVLKSAIDLVKPNGQIFLGDIQGNSLLPIYHSTALLSHNSEETPVGKYRQKVQLRINQETELSIDPIWFTEISNELPRVTHIEILLRRGKFINETTQYHYDAILHVESTRSEVDLPPATEWQNLNLEQLEAQLLEESKVVYLIGIPDSRLCADIHFKKSLDALNEKSQLPSIPQTPLNGISAEDIYAIACACSYKAHVRWESDGTNGLLSAVLIPITNPGLPKWPKAIRNCLDKEIVNNPYSDEDYNKDIFLNIKSYLVEKLPVYMVPKYYSFLDKFPLSLNGKIDRNKLPEIQKHEFEKKCKITLGPSNEKEKQLLEIWKNIFNNENISIYDDIFELGGDSILIFQITTRSKRLGFGITPSQIFQHRNIFSICKILTDISEIKPTPAIQRVNRDGYRRN